MVHYQDLAERVLNGTSPTRKEALSILSTPQGKLLELVNAAYTIRSHYFGNTVRLQMLMNAKSGACKKTAIIAHNQPFQMHLLIDMRCCLQRK